ncbi:MAG: hypothetical protein N4A74_15300 [Carboxylicivirga sp.]|jgi:hypothetical protein|nr:hypothetical protein [Carboxylicivirga sp.]
MQKFSKIKVEESLKSEFPDVQIVVSEVKLVGKLAVITALFKTEKSLEEDWAHLSSSVCSHYQMKLDDDFAKWNTYLIYACNENVEKGLKYRIENNKFSNRKIVVNNSTKNLDDEWVDKIISEKILLDKLEINSDAEIRDNASLSLNPNISKILQSVESNDEVSVEEILFKIETQLKDENIKS